MNRSFSRYMLPSLLGKCLGAEFWGYMVLHEDKEETLHQLERGGQASRKESN